MAGSFLNLDDTELQDDAHPKLGSGIKKKKKPERQKADPSVIAEAGKAHGFTRTTDPVPTHRTSPRKGRPPLNDEMTYWRIYVAPQLREELNALRDHEGRRLNDVLEEMLKVYKSAKKIK